jgi:S-DNA-T family DNA segregation ATPase FtsK/SpoIIIE
LVRTALSRRLCEVVGVVFFGLALLWVISLASYSANDPVLFFSTAAGRPGNFGGRVGALLAELAFQVLGYGAYLLPPALVVVGWHYFWVRVLTAPWTKLAGGLVLFAATGAVLAIAFGRLPIGGKSFAAGGALGAGVAGLLTDQLNRSGALVLVLTGLFLSLLMVTQLSFGAVASAIGGWARRAATERISAIGAWREDRRREKQRQDVIRKHLEKGTSPEAVEKAVTKADAARAADGKRPSLAMPAAAGKAAPPAKAAASLAGLDDDEDDDDMADRAPAARAEAPSPAKPAAKAAAPVAPSVTPQPAPKPREAARIAAPPLPLSDAEPMKAPAERRKGDYALPPLALLDAARAERKVDERLLMDAARHLEDKCREFSVEGSVTQIHPGPVVTTFELKPDAGVKYSKITGLSDDLSLAMKAESVLIDRIPGKSTVGIQIPNVDREQISLREMLESEVYQNASSKLMMALGKSIHGEPFFADLATMPHLLIAGSTGTGKSVGLNSMLTSILYRATPEDVRLIMIDPKRLELGMYADIPHLLTPVVVDPKLAANALKWAVGEMEHRYKTMASEHVRNIEQYNRNMRIKIQGNEMLDNGEPPRTLPFIVVVIDELADLMMVAGHEVEESICRLAQMARAVGIHLILATQRPSVDVITGLIKANLPARISFRVSSKTDSRTILDANGADKLLGKGDMLFLPPSSHRLLRLHGAYISEQESARLASFLRKQGRPTYDVSITDDEKSVSSIEFDRDELYDEASRIVVTSRQASISFLQRRLRVGFSRAARLVDMMEADGLVSSGAGGKARDVLVPANYFDEVDNRYGKDDTVATP